MFRPNLIDILTEKRRREKGATGGRINFDSGGSALQRLQQEIVNSMKPYAPGVSEDRLWIIVKDIHLGMTAEEAQASAKSNFIKLFGMADGGIIGEGGMFQGEDMGSRSGFKKIKKSSKVKTKAFPVKRQFYNRTTGKLETLYFKGQPITKVKKRLAINKVPRFKELYRAQNTFKDMAKTLGVSYEVLKDLEEELIDEGRITKRKLSRVPSFRNPITGDIETKQTIARAKKVTQMADFIDKEIKKFNKTKILPAEKYEINPQKFMDKFDIGKQETLTFYLDSVDAEKNLDYERPRSDSVSRRAGLTEEQINKYKKEYKSKPLNTIVKEITGKDKKNKNSMRIRGALDRLKNTLINQKLINVEDIATRPKVPFKFFKKTSASASQTLQKQVDLAAKEEGLISDPKYFSKKVGSPFFEKFNPQTFDRGLLKFLNMDTIEGSLDPKFPYWSRPSFEHVEGITPGHIIGDSKALRAVTLATKRYNLKQMGATSGLYKDVKDYLRVAVKALENNDKTIANDAVKLVNEVYDKVSTRFPNLDRKDLPHYSIKAGDVKEMNLKGLIKPQKIEDSFKIYFKNVADTVPPGELKRIKRVQPNAFKVIDLFQKGKIKEGYDFIKSRMPSVKGPTGRFAVPILAGGTALNILTNPAEAADDTGQMPQGSPGQLSEEEKDTGIPYEAGAATAAALGKYGPQIWKGAKAVGKGILKPVMSPAMGAGLATSEFVDIDPFSDEFGSLKDDPNVSVAGSALLWPDIMKRLGSKVTTTKKFYDTVLRMGVAPRLVPHLIKGMTGAGLVMIAGDVAHKVATESQPNLLQGKFDPEKADQVFPALIEGFEKKWTGKDESPYRDYSDAMLKMKDPDDLKMTYRNNQMKENQDQNRFGFKYGGSWVDWKINFDNQMTFEEYLQMDLKNKKSSKLNKAEGGPAYKPIYGKNAQSVLNLLQRDGLKDGSPKSPSKRAFIKGLGALAVLPIVGRFFKLGKVFERASTYTGPTIDKIKDMPEWFPGLVKKLWNEGEDVTKKMAYKDRQVVKRGSLEDGDDVDMIYDLDTGNVSINVAPKKGTYETGSGAYNKEYSLDYQRGDVIEEGPYAGKRGPGEFGVAEGRPIQTGADDFDIDYDQYLDVDDAMSDLTELEAFAKNKSTKQIHKQKGTKKKDIFPDYDPPEYDPN